MTTSKTWSIAISRSAKLGKNLQVPGDDKENKDVLDNTDETDADSSSATDEGAGDNTIDFVLRVGSPGVDHTVIWRGRKKNLSAVAPHVAVQFAARPVSLLYRWWRQIWPHPATPS